MERKENELKKNINKKKNFPVFLALIFTKFRNTTLVLVFNDFHCIYNNNNYI